MIIKAGHKAYYDDLPRYKNPYKERESVPYELWNSGWDQAKTEHDLFTENQRLKAEKESLELEISELKGDIDFAHEQVERFKNDIDKIDELAHSLVGYINETNKFRFSREKMINILKCMFKKESPEVKKNNSK